MSAATPTGAEPGTDPLPSWNEGPAKDSILTFVQKTTDATSPDFVREEDRLATFDQDGTLWVEQPFYAQVAFALDRLAELAPRHPEWTTTEPFKSALARDMAAFATFTMRTWSNWWPRRTPA